MAATFTPIRRVLIANRGEIAVRIARSCRERGVETVAVHSEADRGAVHTRACDRAEALVGEQPWDGYLDIEQVIDIAQRSGADAIHPGYGFLSERRAFAEACEAAGLTFIGPRPDTIETMGSKTAARASMQAAGVPVVPGYQGDDHSDERLVAEAARIGYPVLVKAVFGGGGKGMRVVKQSGELLEAVGAARREAAKAFGDGAIFLERFVERPRHIEVQILGDGQGGVVHLFERECSIQRRHQKIIEECPSPSLTPELREQICAAGRQAGVAVDYRGAGTVEFLLSPEGEFFFLEMNTRLQVEHPVTELATGVDLVAAQLHVAEHGALPFLAEDLELRGHAIECRIYAEDPATGFLPSIGTIHRLRVPEGPGVRNDSGIESGSEVTSYYDPMLAKLCTWGRDRQEATRRMQSALAQYVVHGPRTNIAFLLEVMQGLAFENGSFHTRWVDDTYSEWAPPEPTTDVVAALLAMAEKPGRAASVVREGGGGAARGPWQTLGAFRMGGS